MSNELYIEPERATNNKINGRFLKGHPAHNKDRKWSEWLPEEKRFKALKNLEKGRGLFKGRILPPSLKRRKKVIAIKDDKLMAFDSIHSAGEKMGLSFKDISRCCNINHKRVTKFRSVKMILFFFETDYEIWSNTIAGSRVLVEGKIGWNKPERKGFIPDPEIVVDGIKILDDEGKELKKL